MQVVENTCIGHEISLRKISEPLALKALDFIPVTAQPQETQCCRRFQLSEGQMCYINSKWGSGTFTFQPPHLRAGFHTTCPRNPDTVMCRYTMKLPELVSQNPRKHTNTRGYFQDTHLQVIFLQKQPQHYNIQNVED